MPLEEPPCAGARFARGSEMTATWRKGVSRRGPNHEEGCPMRLEAELESTAHEPWLTSLRFSIAGTTAIAEGSRR